MVNSQIAMTKAARGDSIFYANSRRIDEKQFFQAGLIAQSLPGTLSLDIGATCD
jgi:chromate transport protein ChrA